MVVVDGVGRRDKQWMRRAVGVVVVDGGLTHGWWRVVMGAGGGGGGDGNGGGRCTDEWIDGGCGLSWPRKLPGSF